MEKEEPKSNHSASYVNKLKEFCLSVYFPLAESLVTFPLSLYFLVQALSARSWSLAVAAAMLTNAFFYCEIARIWLFKVLRGQEKLFGLSEEFIREFGIYKVIINASSMFVLFIVYECSNYHATETDDNHGGHGDISRVNYQHYCSNGKLVVVYFKVAFQAAMLFLKIGMDLYRGNGLLFVYQACYVILTAWLRLWCFVYWFCTFTLIQEEEFIQGVLNPLRFFTIITCSKTATKASTTAITTTTTTTTTSAATYSSCSFIFDVLRSFAAIIFFFPVFALWLSTLVLEFVYLILFLFVLCPLNGLKSLFMCSGFYSDLKLLFLYLKDQTIFLAAFIRICFLSRYTDISVTDDATPNNLSTKEKVSSSVSYSKKLQDEGVIDDIEL